VHFGVRSPTGYKWETLSIKGADFGAEETFKERKILCELGAQLLSLIKSDMWGRITCTESTRSAPSFPFTPFTAAGSHRAEPPSSLPCCDLFLFNSIFLTEKKQLKMEKGSIGYGILQMIYRWKALDEENSMKQ
jgi:hypothetical protein